MKWCPRAALNKHMGRKSGAKGGGRRGGASSDDEGDKWSEASSEISLLSGDVAAPGASGEDGDEEAGAGVNFMEALEALSEKRTSTRESGLRTIISALRAHSCVDVLQSNKETTLSSLVPLIKRAGNTEGALLAQAIGVVMLLLGPEEDAAFSEVMAPLQAIITRSAHNDYRVEATNALCLACFITCSDEEISGDILQLMEAIFSSTSEGVKATDDVKAAAVDGWCLLATVAPGWYMTDELRAKLLNTFYTLLTSPSAELKVAAGEALAYLNEYWIERRVGFDYPEEEEEVVDSIVQKLSELAKDGSKKISKKERKQQRSSFREVFRAFAESEPPNETISFRTQSFRLTSWAKVKQMEAIRDCLQGGFLAHLEANETLHDIFEIPAHTFSEVQDRRVVDKTSELGKMRTNARTANRRSRENAKGHFIAEALIEGADG